MGGRGKKPYGQPLENPPAGVRGAAIRSAALVGALLGFVSRCELLQDERVVVARGAVAIDPELFAAPSGHEPSIADIVCCGAALASDTAPTMEELSRLSSLGETLVSGHPADLAPVSEQELWRTSDALVKAMGVPQTVEAVRRLIEVDEEAPEHIGRFRTRLRMAEAAILLATSRP